MPGCCYLFSVSPVQTWFRAHTEVFGSTKQKIETKSSGFDSNKCSLRSSLCRGGMNGLRDQEAGAMNDFPVTRDSTLS